jgi:hypothetical protein
MHPQPVTPTGLPVKVSLGAMFLNLLHHQKCPRGLPRKAIKIMTMESHQETSNPSHTHQIHNPLHVDSTQNIPSHNPIHESVKNLSKVISKC